jgi:hypothetical protein
MFLLFIFRSRDCVVRMPNFNFVGHDLQARAFFCQICEVGAGLAIFHKRTLPNFATGKTGT